MVAVARMLPTARTIISVPAGLLRMHLVRFLVWSTIGTAVWSSALAVAGWFLGQNFGEIDKVVGPVSSAVIVAIVAFYIWRQLTWHKRVPQDANAPDPAHPE